MKTLTAKNQNLSLEENIHSALKREFGYAKPLTDDCDLFIVGARNEEIQVLWEKNVCCEFAINTRVGKCYVMFTNK